MASRSRGIGNVAILCALAIANMPSVAVNRSMSDTFQGQTLH